MYRIKDEKHKLHSEVLIRAHKTQIYQANPLSTVLFVIIKFFWLTKLIINKTNVYTAFRLNSIKECDHQMIGSLVLGLEQMWGLSLLGTWWLQEKQRFPVEILLQFNIRFKCVITNI